MTPELERVAELAAEELAAERAAAERGAAERGGRTGRTDVERDRAAGEHEAELERENRRLREANTELRRANAALARDATARRDSAAASAIERANAAERTLLRSQAWDEWPLPLRFFVAIALRLRKLRRRLFGG